MDGKLLLEFSPAASERIERLRSDLGKPNAESVIWLAIGLLDVAQNYLEDGTLSISAAGTESEARELIEVKVLPADAARSK